MVTWSWQSSCSAGAPGGGVSRKRASRRHSGSGTNSARPGAHANSRAPPRVPSPSPHTLCSSSTPAVGVSEQTITFLNLDTKELYKFALHLPALVLEPNYTHRRRLTLNWDRHDMMFLLRCRLTLFKNELAKQPTRCRVSVSKQTCHSNNCAKCRIIQDLC